MRGGKVSLDQILLFNRDILTLCSLSASDTLAGGLVVTKIKGC